MKIAKTVLVVEDEAAERQAIREALRRSGRYEFEVEVATGPEDILARQLHNRRFDVYIVDLALTSGDRTLFGHKIVEARAQEDRGATILVYSAKPQLANVARALQLGASDFASKSECPPHELVQRVERLLDEPAEALDRQKKLNELVIRRVPASRGRVLAIVGDEVVAGADGRLAAHVEYEKRRAEHPDWPGDPVWVELRSSQVVAAATELFISYSHSDSRFKDDFEKHMAPLSKYGEIKLWSDTQIRPSEQWLEAIQEAMDRAQVAVMLVSKNYLSSRFCTDVELPRFVEAQAQRGLKLVAVIIKDCYWQSVPAIGQSQVLPLDTANRVKPIQSTRDKDRAWTGVVKAIEAVLQR
jgi:CheY-like chemotaxis protein